MRHPYMRIRHKATGKTAIGMRRPDGCVVVQFDDVEHPKSHGWHLYPRHHWARSRAQAVYDRRQMMKKARHVGMSPLLGLPFQPGPGLSMDEAVKAVLDFREVHAPIVKAWSELSRSERAAAEWREKFPGEPLPPFLAGNQAGYYP